MYSVTHLPQSKFHHLQSKVNPDLSILNQTQEIIFIDSNVSDIEQLIAGTKANAAVYILHPQEDGIAQITSILKSHSHLQAIHIVSHGMPGCVFLGNSVLNLETLKSYTSQLESWSVPYLLLYGCQVGKDQAFVQQLSHLTQSIIAASDDVTGNPKSGGNWDLEITTGNINISLAFEPEVMANYPSVLGAELVKDIVVGSGYPSFNDFNGANNTFYFEAGSYDSNLGIFTNQLWTSNGSETGTKLVKDFLGDNPYNYIPVGDSVYFKLDTYNSSTGYQYQLWKSNGTTAGTTLLKNFGNNYNWGDFTTSNNTLYFTVNDTTYGTELWKSDGTAAGTTLLKDIKTGSESSYSHDFTPVNDTLYFIANDGINGEELWKTNGTTAGTTLVKDINAGSPSSYPYNLTAVNNTLYFTANDGTKGYELWKTDGTTAGTVLLKDILPGSGAPTYSEFTSAENTLYFEARLYDATLEIYTNQLWKSDGTASGTTLVKNFLGDNPSNYIAMGDSVYFMVNSYNSTTGYNYQLWKSNGKPAGTTLVKDFGSNSNFYDFTVANNTLYFSHNDPTYGIELWKSDGTTAGTTLLKDINEGANGSYPDYLTDVNGTLYFTATNGIYGEELWKSNGTPAGTTLVQDINLGSSTSSPERLTPVNGTLYFSANDNIHGYELWRSTDFEGTSGVDTLNGTPGNDYLYGYGGNDILNALAGNDFLDGGTGADQLKGSKGNDTYIVDNAGDIVTESANEGTDLIKSSVTYTLPANVENLTLTGTTKINGIGNSLVNIINGNTANNTLNGSTGADQLKGNTGNDTYIVDNAGDIVTELANEGTDLIKSSVTYTLPAKVENLTLTGTAAINGTGNTLANIITGNTANNTLNGGDGNDSLTGGAANDPLTGGLGADKFIYNTNAAFTTSEVGVDTITDFKISQTDQIVLDKTTFPKISSVAGTGFSVISEFANVTTDALAATSAADIVYNTATGGLFYNQNGTAAGLGTGAKFLTLTNKPALTASQFLIQA